MANNGDEHRKKDQGKKKRSNKKSKKYSLNDVTQLIGS